MPLPTKKSPVVNAKKNTVKKMKKSVKKSVNIADSTTELLPTLLPFILSSYTYANTKEEPKTLLQKIGVSKTLTPIEKLKLQLKKYQN